MEYPGGNFDLGKRGENLSLKEEVMELVTGAGEYITETFNLQKYTDNTKAFIKAHPFASSFLAISFTTCLIPVLSFLVFAFSTLFVALVILLMIVGSIISCAGIVLLFVLGGCLTFSFGLSITMAFTYKSVSILMDLFQRTQPKNLSTHQPSTGISVSTLSSKSNRENQESDEFKEQ